MSEVNGAELPHLKMQNPVIDVLETMMREAKAGRIASIAFVMVDPNGGVATPWVGGQIPQIYLGAGMLQSRILQAIEAPAKRSSIVPARSL